MADASQYAVKHRELLELLIRHVGVHEGQWMLTANFGMAPGNFGPTPETVAPGMLVVVNHLGIQRVEAGTESPAPLTLDAAVVNPKSKAKTKV